jgi:hypothetical protein
LVSPRSRSLTQDGRLATAGAVAEAATAEAVVVSTEEEAVSTAAVLLVDSMGKASAVARSTAVVVSVEDVSAAAVSTAVAFVATVLVITDSLMMSSSATSAFRVGGAGAIRTDITVMTITPTITMAMDTAGTHTAITMDTADTVTTVAPVMDIAMEAERVMDIAMAADQGMCGVREVGDKPCYGSLKISGRGYV